MTTTSVVREVPEHDPALLLRAALGLSEANVTRIMQAIDGDLRRLLSWSAAQWERVEGIGERKANALVALGQLIAHIERAKVDTRTPFRGPRDVAAYFAPRLQDVPIEEFHVAILDAQHRLVRSVMITRGILNSSLVHPREVFHQAIAERAAAVILAHNHPSGDPTPSAEDRQVTEQLVAAGRLLDIPVHDHVIIGRGRYTSFAEAGLI